MTAEEAMKAGSAHEEDVYINASVWKCRAVVLFLLSNGGGGAGYPRVQLFVLPLILIFSFTYPDAASLVLILSCTSP